MTVDYDQIREENIVEYGQGTRHLEFLGRLYADRTHFIFELLQNAEDARASEVSFTLRADRLEVQHDGRPFNDADVRGICGIADGTKADDLTQIGRFGIGFKSVYAFTQRPEVHSAGEHFCIEQYVRPKGVPATATRSGETLLMFPFDRPDVPAEMAVNEISEALNSLSLRTLLFLRRVQRVYVSGEQVMDAALERAAAPHTERSERVSLTEIATGTATEQSDWYVWSREVDLGAGPGLSVQVAFAIGPDGTTVESLAEAPLVAFFDTEKETHLGFLAQGPYRTTPARDNVPHQDPVNEQLVSETALLLRAALSDLRDAGLLGIEVLQALPIDVTRFPPGSMFRPLFEQMLDALELDPIIPTVDGGHAAAPDVRLARGGGLRELLSGDPFGQLLGSDDTPVRWVIDTITENRTPVLWRYLRDQVGIGEVTPEGVVQRLTAEFLADQPDAWLIDLYSFLRANPALWRKPARLGPVPPGRSRPFIRLEDGTQVAPFDANDRPQAYLPSGSPSEFPTVRASVAANETARAFLVELGLVEPDATAEVQEFVLPRYRNLEPAPLEWTSHAADLDLIRRAIREAATHRADRLKKTLRSSRFLRATNPVTGEQRFRAPSEVYRSSSELEIYFANNTDTWVLGHEYDPWNDLLGTLGVPEHPRISFRRPDRLGYVEIADQHANHKRGVDGFDPDATIDGLDVALANPTHALAQYVWSELLAPNRQLISGTVEWSSRQGFPDPRRTEHRSVLGETAFTKSWLPSPDGNWVMPSQLALADLPGEYKRDETLARALGMTLPVVEDAAQELGVSSQMLRELRDPEVRAAFSELLAARATDGSGDGFEEEDDGEDMDSGPQDVDFVTALAEAFDKPAKRRGQSAIKPSGEVQDPDLRRRRTQEALAEDKAAEPDRQARFGRVPRSVWEKRDSATRHFIEEQYAGRCQICGDTFAKRNGSPYFEALSLVSRTRARWFDRPGNVLCLCATCCAKLQHGPVEAHDIIEQIAAWRSHQEGGAQPRLLLQVCGLDTEVKFTERHMLDLQEMVRS